MSRTLKLGGTIAVLVLTLACQGPGASPTPKPTGTSTPAPTGVATATPSVAPTSSPTTEPTSSGPTPSPSPTPPPAAVEGTLTIWVDETRAPIMVELGQQFTAVTNVPVQVYQVGFGDIRDNLVLRGPRGEGPDLLIGGHDWLGQLATDGLVEPMDLGDKADMVDPVALAAFTYDAGNGAQLYGLPYAMEAIGLVYNTDLVPEPPATWEDLIALATQLQTDNGLEQAFILQEKDPYHSYPVLTANGGYIFGKNADGTYNPDDVGLDSEGGLAYARMLDQMIKDGVLRAGVNYDVMIQLMSTGEAAMAITGPWALPAIRDGGVNIAVTTIPSGAQDARPFVGVQGFMVNAFSPNKLLAQTFVTEYIATDETMQAMFDADPRPSTWGPVADGIEDPVVQGFIANAANGDPMPAIPQMSAVWTDWTDALDLIFTQGQDAEQAVRDAATEIRAKVATE